MSDIIYPNMYKPLKVGNLLLKSRFYASQSKPHSCQGPEPYPAEGFVRHYVNKARNGAAYVTMSGGMTLGAPVRTRGFHPNTQLGHFPGIDIYDSTVQNYVAQLADAIHFYDSKACFMVNRNPEPGVDCDNGVPPFIVEGDGGGAGFVGSAGRRITEKEMIKLADDTAIDCAILQECGVDMVYMHSAYRLMLTGRFLSPRTNFRDDEWGGSIENRSRFLFMICDKIKERCGKDFPIEVSFTAFDNEDPDPAKHWTLDDTREFVNLAKGHIDILQVRPHSVEYVHNMGFEKPLPTLEYARVAKEAAGDDILIACVSGYNHPDIAENVLADGSMDLIGMTRSFISNPEWGTLCKEGRGEDIVPCVKCNKCHRNSFTRPHQAVCSVNPLFGIEHRIDYLKNPVKEQKNLAIVGGGPAGMRAALYAVENGHRVTLFEKEAELGGLLNLNKHCEFKWPVHNYNEWLKKKVIKNPKIDVRLNTCATSEMLKLGNYDEIFACIGASPRVPQIPGIENSNAIFAGDVFGSEEKVGQKVVIIGGGEVGVEAGFHLCRAGRDVFVIEQREKLMMDSTPIHYRVRYKDEWNKTDNFNFVCNAKVEEIKDGKVIYKDEIGVYEVEADTIIYAVGLKAKEEEALGLYWPGKEIHLLGDCKQPGSIQTCTRDAYQTVNAL